MSIDISDLQDKVETVRYLIPAKAIGDDWEQIIAERIVAALADQLRRGTDDAHSVTYKQGWDAGHLCAAKDAENRIAALEADKRNLLADQAKWERIAEDIQRRSDRLEADNERLRVKLQERLEDDEHRHFVRKLQERLEERATKLKNVRAENAKLRKALNRLVAAVSDKGSLGYGAAIQAARDALSTEREASDG